MKLRIADIPAAALLLPLLITSCSGPASVKKAGWTLSPESPIERAAELLSETEEGKFLVRYLETNSVHAGFSSLKGPWPRILPAERKILIPGNARKSDITVALLLARAAHIYLTYSQTGIFDLLAEQEELAAVSQARLALELGFSNSEAEKSPSGTAVLEELCPYLFQGCKWTMDIARKNAIDSNPEYGRPLDTADSIRTWLTKTKTAITEGAFPQAMYQRDLEKVKKKTLTRPEAVKNYADRRALPQYDINRAQRDFYQSQMEALLEIDKLRESAVKSEPEWRAAHVLEIEKGMAEFSACLQ